METELTIDQWRRAEQRLRTGPAAGGAVRERIVAALVSELRRRLGGRFTAAELVELYRRGTTWCLQLAIETAPGDPSAWDSAVTVDAAFARYLREAADYAGGRHVPAQG